MSFYASATQTFLNKVVKKIPFFIYILAYMIVLAKSKVFSFSFSVVFLLNVKKIGLNQTLHSI